VSSRQIIQSAYEEACLAEIEALKPGNVHRFADGHGMSAEQFRVSARASAPAIANAGLPVGQRILEAVRATRAVVATNTNLGILLLSAPIARAAEMQGDLRGNLEIVLGSMDMDDAHAVFEAIALASPGGLGAAQNDVRRPPAIHLVEAMREASGRDMIARQYATGFADIFDTGVAALAQAKARGAHGMWPVVDCYLRFLAGFPDSHVARKHGMDMAGKVRDEAAAVLAEMDAIADEAGRIGLLMAFDESLKARRINPGTSADLTVASLLVHLLTLQLA
jgi:triphosphoribosyl-dephospho-CoA synthase